MPVTAPTDAPAAREPKSYRFKPQTAEMIDRLAVRLNLSATAVVELAVKRLFDAEALSLEEAPPS